MSEKEKTGREEGREEGKERRKVRKRKKWWEGDDIRMYSVGGCCIYS